MNLLILGATGPTGLELVRLAVHAGHETTALVRDKSKMPIKSDLLTVIAPDLFDEEAMSYAITGNDCVLSALGRGRDLHSTIASQAVNTLIPAMERAKVSRLIFLSSFGVGQTRQKAKLFSRIFFSTFLKDVLLDKERADNLLGASNLNYTLVYPTRLTNGQYTGHYQVGVNVNVGWWPKISRSDVADFMMTLAEKNPWNRQTVIITY